ncbi:MAG: fatty acid desaturase, partial [Acidimicrobiaceae bacterium]|nr:fatty acid desaturase [Acidimicrobiaceae bacterium]MYJ41483.1 fatty acid desaturase [Acidimicrobiaceae bacterium]
MTAAVRDYGLTGNDSRLAIERGLVEAEWFRPPIDPERLRAL